MEPDLILKMVFSILFVFSFFLNLLFYSHVQLICSAQTTLERLVELNQVKRSLLLKLIRSNDSHTQQKMSSIKRINPFNQGWKQNMKQILGEPMILIWIPVRRDHPIPYLPQTQIKKSL